MKAKKIVCIYWMILVMIFGGIIGIRSTEIKVEAAERQYDFGITVEIIFRNPAETGI